MSSIKKVVLAYSGGLDTSIILKWIKNTYNCEVVTFTADLGQGEELDGVEAKALATGATKAYVEDIREEYARDFVFPMLRAAALYEGRYLLGTSIARPLIAKRMCEMPRPRAPRPWPTAPRARATTRCASSSPPWRSIPSSRPSPPGATGT
jgi:Argininosuccinate synthase